MTELSWGYGGLRAYRPAGLGFPGPGPEGGPDAEGAVGATGGCPDPDRRRRAEDPELRGPRAHVAGIRGADGRRVVGRARHGDRRGGRPRHSGTADARPGRA